LFVWPILVHEQGCQVAELSVIFADFGRMKKLLAEWKNCWPNGKIHCLKWPKVA
jgi:hypothetical protein